MHYKDIMGKLSITATWLIFLPFIIPTTSIDISCYNQKCRGSINYSDIIIPCDNGANKCSYNTSGYPECDPGSKGVGVSCNGRYKCRYNEKTGEAYCSSRSGSWQCYDQLCNGIGEFQNTSVTCDNKYNYCSRDETGQPVCTYTEWGGDGVTCASENCKEDEFTGKAYCEPASRTLYFIWGGVVGGAAFMSAVLYMSVKCVRRFEKPKERTSSETERLVPEKREKRDYRRRYSNHEPPKVSSPVSNKSADDPEERSETHHTYVNV